MMHMLLALRVILCVLFGTLLSTASYAQQVGSYPADPITVEKGSYYCQTPELVTLLLDMVKRNYTDGHPAIPINGCGRTTADLRVTLTYVRTYNSGLTEADILQTEIYSDVRKEEEPASQIYIVGEERLVWAIL
jgi:hypothetical protein